MARVSKLPYMIKQLMTSKQLTMKELGELVGKSESAVSYWISGKVTPRFSVIQNLADIFNITTDELIYGYNNQQNGSDTIINGVNLSNAQFALYGKVEDLTNEELVDVANYINLIKARRK